eukprot:gene16249-22424_t
MRFRLLDEEWRPGVGAGLDARKKAGRGRARGRGRGAEPEVTRGHSESSTRNQIRMRNLKATTMASRLQLAVLAFAVFAVLGGCMWELQSVSCTGYNAMEIPQKMCLAAGYKSFINGAIPGYCYNVYSYTSEQTSMHAMCWRIY